MDIKILPDGEPAPVDADCVNIEPGADGKFMLSGNALCGEEVVSLISSTLVFDDRESAREQGIAWADAQGVELLYVTFAAPAPSD
ncbi:MAG: hypothetical protein EOP94_04085 [Zymomonas sp.]|nr:MAG: hypothetical protein EOP94_04085 [Zymomonas sp.]